MLAPYKIVMVYSHSAFIALAQDDVTNGTDQIRPQLHLLGNDRSKDCDTAKDRGPILPKGYCRVKGVRQVC